MNDDATLAERLEQMMDELDGARADELDLLEPIE